MSFFKNLKEGQVSISQPFGPSLAMAKLPKDVLSGLKEVTSEILTSPDRNSYGSKLAGVINEEPMMNENDFIQAGANKFIEQCIYAYIIEASKKFGYKDCSISTFIREAWLVSQFANEYNPIHNHLGCEISSVIYLNVPKMKGLRNLKTKAGKVDNDGDLNFIYSSGDRGTDILENGKMRIVPEEGLMIVFPSFLYHAVYPFIGDGERRSIAFNASYRIVKKDINGKIQVVSGSEEGVQPRINPYKNYKRNSNNI